jgi:hypothetical protein
MLERILDYMPEVPFVLLEGYDDCVLGFDYGDGDNPRMIYSVKGILDKLAKDMSDDEAIEYFEYNIRGSFSDNNMKNCPIFCQDDV